MDNSKKAVVTIWICSTLLAALFFILPGKADHYFLSLRVLEHENKIVATEASQKNIFKFLRSSKDDVQMNKMLEERVRDDGKWLVICLGCIFMIINTMSCLLYIFNMKPAHIVLWVSGFFLVTGLLIFQSLIRINPFLNNP